MKDMGEADIILGTKIKPDNKGIVITQSHYIEKILKKFNREDFSPVSTPMDPVVLGLKDFMMILELLLLRGDHRIAMQPKVTNTVDVEYGVSTSIGYGISSSLSNTAYSSQQIDTAYPLPLDTAYRSSGTETKILDFRAKIFLPSLGTNPTDCLSFVSGSA
ncbi:hypothetical protein Tco_1007917 [Tanacetum coccineum]